MASVNYSQLEGIHSLAAAIIFAVVYAFLFAFYLFTSILRRSQVFYVLTFFCLIRIVAFAMRAALAGSTTSAENENLLIADLVIYNVGFFGLLYSAYSLVLDREALVDLNVIMQYCPGPLVMVFGLSRKRMLVRVVCIAAIVLGIVGTTQEESSTTTSQYNSALNLRSASVYIFLVVACLLAINALTLSVATIKTYHDKTASEGHRYGGRTTVEPPAYATVQPRGPARIGETYGIFVLLIIAALLLVRQAFYAATEHQQSKQLNEKLWYPLSALTELLAVLLFAVPGLVPARSSVPVEERELGFLDRA